MRLPDVFRRWLRATPPPPAPARSDEIQEALDVARYARRSENHTGALNALARAGALADARQDPVAGAAVMLQQGQVLTDQGQHDEAERLLTSALSTADALALAANRAYGLCALADLYQQRGQWDQAQVIAVQAREYAAQHDVPGAEGRAMGLLAVGALRDGNQVYARRLLETSLPKLQVGDDFEQSATLVGLLGQTMIAQGEAQEGQLMLQRALRLAEQMQAPREVRRWALALAEDAALRDQHADADTYYARALALFPSGPGVDYARALMQASTNAEALRQPAQALRYARQALDVAPPSSAVRVQAQVTLALHLRAAGQADEAEALLDALDDHDALPPAQRVAVRRAALGKRLREGFDAADQPLFDALVREAEAHNLTSENATLHRDWGLRAASVGAMAQAIEVWGKGLVITDDPRATAGLLVDSAVARRALGQVNRAMRDLERALMLLSSIDDANTRGLVLANAATLYADQGDPDTAEAFFKEAIAIAERTQDAWAESVRRGNYAGFLAQTGQSRLALPQLERAAEIARRLLPKRPQAELLLAVQTSTLGVTRDAMSSYEEALRHHQAALGAPKLPYPPRWEVLFLVRQAQTLAALGRLTEAQQQQQHALDLLEQADTTHATLLERIAANDVSVRVVPPVSHFVDLEVRLALWNTHARLVLIAGDLTACKAALDMVLERARRTDMRRALAEALTTYSELMARQNEHEQAEAAWDEAQRLWRVLRAPLSQQRPVWLGGPR